MCPTRFASRLYAGWAGKPIPGHSAVPYKAYMDTASAICSYDARTTRYDAAAYRGCDGAFIGRPDFAGEQQRGRRRTNSAGLRNVKSRPRDSP